MKKMRKVLVAFLAVICMVTCLSIGAFGASGEEGNRVYAEAPTSAAQGDYQYCSVYIEDLTDLAALNVALYYDSSQIEIQYTYNSVSCNIYDYSEQNGCLQYTYIFNGDISGKTCLFAFGYKIKENAEVGTGFFDIAVSDAYNTSLETAQVGGSRHTFQIEQRQQNSSFWIYANGTATTSVKEEFELTYEVYENLASGSFVIQYDSELFDLVDVTAGSYLDGYIVDINAKTTGAVNVSFVGSGSHTGWQLLKVKFRTKKNVTQDSPITLVAKDFYDTQLNSLNCSGHTCNVSISFDETYTEDSPGMILSSQYDREKQKLTLTVKLEKDSCLGAGDFVVSFDSTKLKYVSSTKKFDPTFFNINDKNVSDGKLKFSIISLTDITDEKTVLEIVFDVEHCCVDTQMKLQISGTGVTDSMTSAIILNYVDCTVLVQGAHAYGENVTPPTCTERGYTTHSCSYCGDSYVDTYVDALGHKDEDKNHQCDNGCGEFIGTCEDLNHDHKCDYGCDKFFGTHADPDKDHNCDYCGEKLSEHSYGEVVTAPTCTERGYTTHSCSYCGDSYVDTYVDALGHKDEDKNHQCDNGCGELIGTCEDLNHDHKCDYGCDKFFGTHADPDKDHNCDYCGEKLSEHSYGEVVTAPTCTERGYTTHSCSYCGDSYVDTYVDAIGHSYIGTVTKEATETEFGEITYTCHCGDHYTEQIPKLDPEDKDSEAQIWIAIVSTGTLAACATGCTVFVIKKRKKHR